MAISNIIGQGSHLEGNINTTGNLRIEGKITGGIKTKAKVVLSHTAQIEGNIVAQNAEIGGEVKGTIEVIELLVLKSTATVWGDIIANKLIFEEGACFDGKCKMGKEHKAIHDQGQDYLSVAAAGPSSELETVERATNHSENPIASTRSNQSINHSLK
ncbi:bactofilin family protein [Cardinium endosymbiont of Oedothorax gibbosus]|uniref:bactofilin family protein n=1 Tax=Cardinium endosymbiont of Oedothorax gibbosus TaxID=931101 RepID=UPI002024D34B|nr:polymer-forming cytoskeletal protein [Cardinium endosymbiont of Oedothorax gibbosus]CAH2560011.1 Bactofilin A/B family protein [Cardinium endosymbiont of Oedothorax gibbosus]